MHRRWCKQFKSLCMLFHVKWTLHIFVRSILFDRVGQVSIRQHIKQWWRHRRWRQLTKNKFTHIAIFSNFLCDWIAFDAFSIVSEVQTIEKCQKWKKRYKKQTVEWVSGNIDYRLKLLAQTIETNNRNWNAIERNVWFLFQTIASIANVNQTLNTMLLCCSYTDITKNA